MNDDPSSLARSAPPSLGFGLIGCAIALVAIGLLVYVWYDEAARSENRVLLATPGAAVASLAQIMDEPRLWESLGGTLRSWLFGFGVAGIAGLAIGVPAGRFPAFGALLGPTLFVLFALPVALAGLLFILWEGLDRNSGGSVAAGVIAFAAITATTIQAQRGGAAMARWRGTLMALEVGAVLALAAVIFVESFGGRRGLGVYAYEAFNQFATARIFAVIILVWALGLLLALPFALVRVLLGLMR